MQTCAESDFLLIMVEENFFNSPGILTRNCDSEFLSSNLSTLAFRTLVKMSQTSSVLAIVISPTSLSNINYTSWKLIILKISDLFRFSLFTFCRQRSRSIKKVSKLEYVNHKIFAFFWGLIYNTYFPNLRKLIYIAYVKQKINILYIYDCHHRIFSLFV